MNGSLKAQIFKIANVKVTNVKITNVKRMGI